MVVRDLEVVVILGLEVTERGGAESSLQKSVSHRQAKMVPELSSVMSL